MKSNKGEYSSHVFVEQLAKDKDPLLQLDLLLLLHREGLVSFRFVSFLTPVQHLVVTIATTWMSLTHLLWLCGYGRATTRTLYLEVLLGRRLLTLSEITRELFTIGFHEPEGISKGLVVTFISCNFNNNSGPRELQWR